LPAVPSTDGARVIVNVVPDTDPVFMSDAVIPRSLGAAACVPVTLFCSSTESALTATFESNTTVNVVVPAVVVEPSAGVTLTN